MKDVVANWKYKTVYTRYELDEEKNAWICTVRGETYDSIDEALNVHGAGGWELVNVVSLILLRDLESYRAFFKAPA